MVGSSWLVPPRIRAAWLAAPILLLFGACSNDVQPAVSQYGQAVTTTARAEDAMYDAIDGRKAEGRTLCLLASTSITIGSDGQIAPRDVSCAASDDPRTTVVPADVRAAIDEILATLQAYGLALQGLAGDTAAAAFDTNVDGLGRSVAAFDTTALAPLGVSGGPTPAQLNAVGGAVKDVGNALIAAAVSRDVQSAARRVQAPLGVIAGTLKTVNGYWTAQLPANQSSFIRNYVIALWPRASLSERQTLMATWAKASAPLTAEAANRALDNLVAANGRIAAAGPTASMVEIKTAVSAAEDAYAAYQALAGR